MKHPYGLFRFLCCCVYNRRVTVTETRVHGHQIFIDGAFNGDPHPGNILLTPDGKLGLIDYGQARSAFVFFVCACLRASFFFLFFFFSLPLFGSARQCLLRVMISQRQTHFSMLLVPCTRPSVVQWELGREKQKENIVASITHVFWTKLVLGVSAGTWNDDRVILVEGAGGSHEPSAMLNKSIRKKRNCLRIYISFFFLSSCVSFLFTACMRRAKSDVHRAKERNVARALYFVGAWFYFEFVKIIDCFVTTEKKTMTRSALVGCVEQSTKISRTKRWIWLSITVYYYLDGTSVLSHLTVRSRSIRVLRGNGHPWTI